MSAQFRLYKGLQKPIVFKMFKGKYIYYAAVGALVAVAAGITVSATVSPILGTVLLIVIASAGLGYAYAQQKKGLYSKKIYKGVYIMHNTASPNPSEGEDLGNEGEAIFN